MDGHPRPLSDISADKLVEFETAVMPIPQFDPDHPQMISQGPSVCVFNKGDPQEVLASWLFTQYLLTNNVQIAYSETEATFPSPPWRRVPTNILIIFPGKGRTSPTTM